MDHTTELLAIPKLRASVVWRKHKLNVITLDQLEFGEKISSGATSIVFLGKVNFSITIIFCTLPTIIMFMS